ncbi:MAG TPA: hypothetical protein VFT23_12005, partial [Burkholderiales bacterium]|nr:hypothetical protein [Burkholderiales bacterium]
MAHHDGFEHPAAQRVLAAGASREVVAKCLCIVGRQLAVDEDIQVVTGHLHGLFSRLLDSTSRSILRARLSRVPTVT